MDCAAMSFDPYNLAFDPYGKLRVFIKKDQTGGAYAIDYPTHNEGRGIVYPASESNPERCVVEIAGHAACVYARDGTLRAVDAQNKGNTSWKVCRIVTGRDIRKDGRTL